MMATRDSIDRLLEEGQQLVQQAEEQLELSNRNNFIMDEEYTSAHVELEALAQRIDRVLQSANPQQREQLQRFQFIVNEKLNDLILDQTDVERYQ